MAGFPKLESYPMVGSSSDAREAVESPLASTPMASSCSCKSCALSFGKPIDVDELASLVTCEAKEGRWSSWSSFFLNMQVAGLVDKWWIDVLYGTNAAANR